MVYAVLGTSSLHSQHSRHKPVRVRWDILVSGPFKALDNRMRYSSIQSNYMDTDVTTASMELSITQPFVSDGKDCPFTSFIYIAGEHCGVSQNAL